MIKCGKTSQQAIAALTSLATVYRDGARPLSAASIASERGISTALISKHLSALSKAGIVNSSPGPNGGFRLARSPEGISLLSIVRVFEPKPRSMECPIDSCHLGDRPLCAFGEELERQRKNIRRFLSKTTLADLLQASPTASDSAQPHAPSQTNPTQS